MGKILLLATLITSVGAGYRSLLMQKICIAQARLCKGVLRSPQKAQHLQD
jgi:hypothetical protein